MTKDIFYEMPPSRRMAAAAAAATSTPPLLLLLCSRSTLLKSDTDYGTTTKGLANGVDSASRFSK
jgi:hypothetical protein